MMRISDKEFLFLTEGITSDVIQLLIDREGYSLAEAVSTVYGSRIYSALLRPSSYLYTQSPGYVFSLIENELASSP